MWLVFWPSQWSPGVAESSSKYRLRISAQDLDLDIGLPPQITEPRAAMPPSMVTTVPVM